MARAAINDAMLTTIADSIERQCCVEIRPPGSTFGVVAPLAAAARQLQGSSPYLLAASALAAIQPGDAILIATGFPVAEIMPMGETDGPPGAAGLAHALAIGLGARPYLLGDPNTVEPIRAACQAIGLDEVCPGDWPDGVAGFAVDAFPADDLAEERAVELLTWLRPRAIVVTEKPGLNQLGIAHRAGGLPTGPGRARIEVLLAEAQRAGVVTIAVGDNGNESGLGLLAPATREHKAFGEICNCPCGGGIAAVDRADIAVVGAVSNWACYGIAALLGVILGRTDLLHDGETEQRVIEACLAAGAVDGFSGNVPMVDGVLGRVNGYVVEVLAAVVRTALGGH
ncbi:MAG: glutamate cyclase domain-containing protein [Chloroflexota bacterium]